MTTHVALFRAVNVGGTGLLPMAALRGLAERLGFEDPRTLLQSGNLVFGARSKNAAALAPMLEAAAADELGLRTRVFVRSAAEWRDIVARNPFPGAAAAAPGRLLMMALERPPGSDAVRRLRESIKGRESVECVGAQLYLVYPDGSGRLTLNSAAIERVTGLTGTARNWNTVLKIAALCGASPPAGRR